MKNEETQAGDHTHMREISERHTYLSKEEGGARDTRRYQRRCRWVSINRREIVGATKMTFENTQTQDAEHVECFEVLKFRESREEQRQINVEPRYVIDRRED